MLCSVIVRDVPVACSSLKYIFDSIGLDDTKGISSDLSEITDQQSPKVLWEIFWRPVFRGSMENQPVTDRRTQTGGVGGTRVLVVPMTA